MTEKLQRQQRNGGEEKSPQGTEHTLVLSISDEASGLNESQSITRRRSQGKKEWLSLDPLDRGWYSYSFEFSVKTAALAIYSNWK